MREDARHDEDARYDRKRADEDPRPTNQRPPGELLGTARSASIRSPDDAQPRELDPDEKRKLDHAAVPLGSASGAVAGGMVGTILLGPLGTAIGAVGGALGGWWAGSAVARSVSYSEDDDSYYRDHYGRLPDGTRAYEDVSPAYHLGHIAASNPDYRGRSFLSVMPDLRRIWNEDLRARHGAWDTVRPYAAEAYRRHAGEHVVERPVIGTADAADAPRGTTAPDLDMGGTASHHRAEFADPGPSDARPEAGFFDRPVGARKPSTGDGAADRADGMGPMIDRGGGKAHDPKPEDSRHRK